VRVRARLRAPRRYIRPDGKQWLKFDDERVQKADEREAMDSQFGG
jgi:ubiquitin carboxyl-terminal hydrolase 7